MGWQGATPCLVFGAPVSFGGLLGVPYIVYGNPVLSGTRLGVSTRGQTETCENNIPSYYVRGRHLHSEADLETLRKRFGSLWSPLDLLFILSHSDKNNRENQNSSGFPVFSEETLTQKFQKKTKRVSTFLRPQITSFGAVCCMTSLEEYMYCCWFQYLCLCYVWRGKAWKYLCRFWCALLEWSGFENLAHLVLLLTGSNKRVLPKIILRVCNWLQESSHCFNVQG